MFHCCAVEFVRPGVCRHGTMQGRALLIGHFFNAFGFRSVAPDGENHHATVFAVGDEACLSVERDYLPGVQYGSRGTHQSVGAIKFLSLCSKADLPMRFFGAYRLHALARAALQSPWGWSQFEQAR